MLIQIDKKVVPQSVILPAMANKRFYRSIFKIVFSRNNVLSVLVVILLAGIQKVLAFLKLFLSVFPQLFIIRFVKKFCVIGLSVIICFDLSFDPTKSLL